MWMYLWIRMTGLTLPFIDLIFAKSAEVPLWAHWSGAFDGRLCLMEFLVSSGRCVKWVLQGSKRHGTSKPRPYINYL
jgi:hypothetical protein